MEFDLKKSNNYDDLLFFIYHLKITGLYGLTVRNTAVVILIQI